MKKTDIAMIVLIASMSVIIAYFAGKAIIGDASQQSVKVKTAEKIAPTVSDPDTKVFNETAINPTVEVTIGGDSKPTTAP